MFNNRESSLQVQTLCYYSVFFLFFLSLSSAFSAKFALAFSAWKQMQSNWNIRTLCRMTSIHDWLFFCAIWPTLLGVFGHQTFRATSADTTKQQSISLWELAVSGSSCHSTQNWHLISYVTAISENMTNIVSAFEELKYSSEIIWMLQGTSLSVFDQNSDFCNYSKNNR